MTRKTRLTLLNRFSNLWRDRRIRFLAVGSWNTVFGYAVFVGLFLILGTHLHYLLVLVLAHVFSVIQAFLAYRRFVFAPSGAFLASLARFWSVYFVALGLNFVLLPVLVEFAGMPPPAAQAVVVGAVVGGTYVAHSRFSFRGSHDPPSRRSKRDPNGSLSND